MGDELSMHLTGHNISIHREKKELHCLPLESVGTAFLAGFTLKFLLDAYLQTF